MMIGNCLVALGRTAEAYEELSATMREAERRAETEPKYVATRDAAAKHVAVLEPKVGKLVIEVEAPAGIEVKVNGAPVSPDKLSVAFAVDPGKVVVTATHTDGRVERREAMVTAGATERVMVRFPKVAPKPEVVIPPVIPKIVEPPSGDVGKGSTMRTAGFVVAGIGAAGMAIFGVTGLMARSRFTTLEDECHSARCTDLKYADVVDSGKALTTAANVSLALGAAGIVGGGLMILLGTPPSAPRAATSSEPSRRGFVSPEGLIVGAGLMVSPGGAGVHCTVAF
jgi:hypothetical protein